MASMQTIVLEHCLKTLAGEEDAALHCTHRQIHLFCDLAVFIACDMHRKRNSVAVAERVDSLADLAGSVAALGSVETGILREIQAI